MLEFYVAVRTRNLEAPLNLLKITSATTVRQWVTDHFAYFSLAKTETLLLWLEPVCINQYLLLSGFMRQELWTDFIYVSMEWMLLFSV